MHYKFVLFIAFLYTFFPLSASCQDVNELHETGKNYMHQGDYANASLVLIKALQESPQNIEISKDLALAYYFQKEYSKALGIIKPLIDGSGVDEGSIQLAANIYRAQNDLKEAEKIYKKGVKMFNSSGPLYNDYGETLWSHGDINAIKQWEKGIEKDPQFSGNYYNAARYYYFSTDKLWSIIYGEIFLNLETFSSRTAEMKGIMLENYRKLFVDPGYFKLYQDKNQFEKAYLGAIGKQAEIAEIGISPSSLTMIRTRFILEWFQQNPTKLTFNLFYLHRKLLAEGLFEAYNQWIFGVAQNLTEYQNWINIHPIEYNEFNKLQKSTIFKPIASQFYHK